MATGSSCDPCFRIDNTSDKEAAKYCVECEDKLCFDCIRAHRGHKASVNHHIIDLDVAYSLPEESIASKRICTRHTDFIMDFFCTFHDTLCCRNCIADDHRSCDKVVPLEKAAEEVKISALYTDVSEGLQHICSTYDSIVKDQEENIKKFEQKGKTIKQKIKEYSQSLIDKIRKLEEKTLSDVDGQVEGSVMKLRSQQSDAGKKINLLKNALQELERVMKHGSNSQIFLFLQNLKSFLTDKERTLSELVPKLVEVDLIYQPQSIDTDIIKLGTVETKYKQNAVLYEPKKNVEAQHVTETFIRPVKSFKLKGTLNVKWDIKTYDFGTMGILITKENQIIVCREIESKLQRFSMEGEYIDSCQLAHQVWGIAYNQRTGQIVATLCNKRLIQFVDNFKPGPTVNVKKDCYGVVWVNDKIFVGGYKTILVLRSDGTQEKELKIGKGTIFYINHFNQKIYLTDDSNKLYCIHCDGTPVFTFSSPNLQNSLGIGSDGNGCIYVVGCVSNNIHRISSDGKNSEVVLCNKDGIKLPVTLCFSRDYKQLFISNDDGRTLLVFNCEY